MLTTDINIFKKFRSKKILVIGELMVDAYLQGSCNRIAPEASVPVIDVHDKKYCLGGAANVAANLSALDAEVFFLSVCGDDDHAILAFELLAKMAVKTDHIIRSAERKTLYKTRVSSESQLLVRFDEGSIAPLSINVKALLLTAIEKIYYEIDAVFIADYGKGLIGEEVIKKIIELNAIKPKIIALDTKNHDRYLALKPTIVKPNYIEAVKIIGIKENVRVSAEELKQWGEKIYKKTAADYIFLTLDAEGVCVFEKGSFKFHLPVPKVEHPSVSGAGDTFLAAALMALIAKANVKTIAEIAISAANQVVKQPHTSVCGLKQLMHATSSQGKLINGKQGIRELQERLCKEGKKIVFTNGCFDILHSGHVSYLRGAKAQGDVLIVGLNTDESIKRLKGPRRPINNLKDRVDVLSELSCIDYVIPFGKPGEDTPVALVQQIKPNVFVKGGDYQDKYLPEEKALRKIGCEIIFLPMVADKSTTNTIKRIQESSLFSTQITVN